MSEVLRRPAHFPNALVRPAPNARQMVKNSAADRHGPAYRRQAVKMSEVEGVENFAVDVELCLFHGGIADAYRPRSFIAGQPWHLPFGESPFAAEPIHDLQLVRAACDRAEQPVSPCSGLVIKARMHQSEQREGGVTQPAITVIPVASAADLLRQRGRRRG